MYPIYKWIDDQIHTGLDQTRQVIWYGEISWPSRSWLLICL